MKPQNKQELLAAAEHEYEKMNIQIGSLSNEEQEANFDFEDRDKNIRDVLAHLYHWHLMQEAWHQEGCVEGKVPKTPAEGYTWRQLPALNLEIWKRYQDTSLEEAKRLLADSHVREIKLIETHTNDELYDKGFYAWTKSSSLATFFNANTASHYVWAQKKIKRHIKTLRTS